MRQLLTPGEKSKLYQAGNSHGLAMNYGYMDINKANIEY